MVTYIAKGEDFTEFDENKDFVLDRIDRNGSHYYHSCKCPKCGGSGYIAGYAHVEGGRCFLCGGSGEYTTTFKVMTEAYNKKLTDRRLAKMRKEATEYNAEFLKSNGFSADGRMWVVLGNTFDIKDELKEAGADYNYRTGWTFSFEQSTYDTLEISKGTDIYGEPLVRVDPDTGWYWFTDNDAREWIKDAKLRREAEIKELAGTASEYIAEVGEKITVKAKLTKISHYDTHYTYSGETVWIYIMKDQDGNKIIWKTSKFLDDLYDDQDFKMVEIGTELEVKGTVKAHSEYKCEKQTELTRCKVHLA